MAIKENIKKAEEKKFFLLFCRLLYNKKMSIFIYIVICVIAITYVKSERLHLYMLFLCFRQVFH